MVALNLCLLGVSIATEPKPQPAAPITKPADSGETVTFSPAPYPPTSTVFKIAMILSLPAMFVGGIVASFVTHSGQAMDIAFCTILVFPLWYRIGNWFDRERAPTAPPQPSPVRDALRGFARAAVGFLLALGIISLTPAYHHRTRETFFFALAYSLWCAGYLACSLWGEQRDNRRARPA
jgi:hypothetical protein